LQKKRYTNAWEQRKFRDFTTLSQGLQIAIVDRFTEPSLDRHFYITNEFLNPDSKKQYFIDSPSKNVIANKSDILMTRTGNTGKVVTDVEGAFHNNFFKIAYSQEEIAKLFLFYLLNLPKIQREMLNRAGNSTIPDLNHADFYKIDVKLPRIEEQTAIGKFFRTLDNTIAIYKRKLDGLRELKKAYLQQMFPQAGETVPRLRFEGFSEPWEVNRLGDVADIVGGGTPDTANNEYWNGDIDWYAPAEIGGQVYISNSRRASITLHPHFTTPHICAFFHIYCME